MELLRDTPEIDLVYRYAEAWNRLDLDDFAAHLAADVSYTSQNVFDVLQGREAVEHYLRSKMQAIRQARGVMVRAEVGFCGSQRGSVVQVLDAAENRACVLLEQVASTEPVALVLLKVQDGKVTRIDLCSVAPHPATAYRTGIYPGIDTAV